MAKKKSAMDAYWDDIATLAKMKENLSPDREISIPVSERHIAATGFDIAL